MALHSFAQMAARVAVRFASMRALVCAIAVLLGGFACTSQAPRDPEATSRSPDTRSAPEVRLLGSEIAYNELGGGGSVRVSLGTATAPDGALLVVLRTAFERWSATQVNITVEFTAPGRAPEPIPLAMLGRQDRRTSGAALARVPAEATAGTIHFPLQAITTIDFALPRRDVERAIDHGLTVVLSGPSGVRHEPTRATVPPAYLRRFIAHLPASTPALAAATPVTGNEVQRSPRTVSNTAPQPVLALGPDIRVLEHKGTGCVWAALYTWHNGDGRILIGMKATFEEWMRPPTRAYLISRDSEGGTQRTDLEILALRKARYTDPPLPRLHVDGYWKDDRPKHEASTEVEFLIPVNPFRECISADLEFGIATDDTPSVFTDTTIVFTSEYLEQFAADHPEVAAAATAPTPKTLGTAIPAIMRAAKSPAGSSQPSSLAPPTLRSPHTNEHIAAGSGGIVSFSWAPVPKAAGYFVEILPAEQPRAGLGLQTPEVSCGIDLATFATKHRVREFSWRVCSQDEAGRRGRWSKARRFTLAIRSESASPSEGARPDPSETPATTR